MTTTQTLRPSRIRSERLLRDIGVRELARRLGVSPGAVSQWERGEERGTIRRSTLEKALRGIDPHLDVTEPKHRVQPAPFQRREQRVSYELHREIAKRLIDSPDEVLSAVGPNIERMRQVVRGPRAHEWLDEWQRLAKGDLGTLIGVMLGTDQHSIDLRQNSPFAGVLSRDERIDAIERANAA
jgi:transcriptional regulator with XRE-family HTH domain